MLQKRLSICIAENILRANESIICIFLDIYWETGNMFSSNETLNETCFSDSFFLLNNNSV